MTYYTIKPSKKLADFVQYFWVFEGTASEAQPYFHRTFANVCPEIVFHYEGIFDEISNDNKLTKNFVTGIHAQTKHYRQFVIKQSFGIFGVYLYPYALSALFDIPTIDFTNQRPDLFSIFKIDGKNIEERMCTAKNTVDRISIISEFLEVRVKTKTPKRPQINEAIKTILKAKGEVNINELASQCCLSVRQFERNFKEYAGFSPKTFSRITRFYAIVEEPSNQQKTLTEIAYFFGYYDQSHFISDFKEFSGICPGEWLRADTIKAME